MERSESKDLLTPKWTSFNKLRFVVAWKKENQTSPSKHLPRHQVSARGFCTWPPKHEPPRQVQTNNSRGGKNEVGKEEGKKSHHLLLFFQILFFFLKSSTGIAREGQDLFTWEIFPFLPAPEVQNGNEGKWGNPLWEGVGQQFSLISLGFLPRTPPAPSISHVPTCLLTC